MAEMQSAGRGSRGRVWQSSPGNLALSVLLRPAGPVRLVGNYALVAGLALAEALPAMVSLKWPNDVVLNGRKLGGVLVESAVGVGQCIDWVVIGLGANLATAPDIPGRQVAALDGAISASDCAQRVLARLSHWLAVAEAGWAPVHAAWLAVAHPMGDELHLRVGARDVRGRFAGLAEDGGLRLEVKGVLETFASGEIWLEQRA